MTGDRAGQSYWDNVWAGTILPVARDLDTPSLRGWIDSHFLRVFRKIIPPGGHPDIIEIGCGNSLWLVYFNRYFNARVTGIDYTESGCATARAVLDAHGVTGDIRRTDLFNPPDDLKNRFDLVYTNGLVEHFEDTAACLRHCAAFARAGGHIVTFIPNLSGALGAAQKVVDRAIYDIHVPMNLAQLKKAHEDAGLEIIDAAYIMPLNTYMLNATRFRDGFWRIPVRVAQALPARLAYLCERAGIKLPASRALSAYIYVIARRA